MRPRNPTITRRNRFIASITERLEELLPQVLEETTAISDLQMHAYFATRKARYIDLENTVIHSHHQYFNLYYYALKQDLQNEYDTNYSIFFRSLFKSKTSKEYLYLFLKRTFLREFDHLTKNRPHRDEAEIWIGQNKADYGLLVSPRYRNGEWENDKSEIRRFSKRYWSIGHVLQTGLVIPDRNEKLTFHNLASFIQFYKDIVRQTGSEYQREIADRYCDFLKQHENPESVLFLVPELRFLKDRKHKYRLDFCVINTETGDKVGFEISPWSTHGVLTGTKNKTQQKINEEALKNFEKEMLKHKEYFLEQGISYLIYTDSDLKNIDNLYSNISQFLNVKSTSEQLDTFVLSEFMEDELN